MNFFRLAWSGSDQKQSKCFWITPHVPSEVGGAGCVPSCAAWPAASHPDWFVCRPWFYSGTGEETEKEREVHPPDTSGLYQMLLAQIHQWGSVDLLKRPTGSCLGSKNTKKSFIWTLFCEHPVLQKGHQTRRTAPSCGQLWYRWGYLQVWNPLLKGLWVLSEQPLLLQELGIVAVRGGLEQAVVQDVPQGFGQGAEHLLLGLPHRGVRVEAQTFLREGKNKIDHAERRIREFYFFRDFTPDCLQ